MSLRLSERLSWPRVGEHARDYFKNRSYHYEMDDLLKIAQTQAQAENELLIRGHRGVICDTNILTTIVWAEVKFGRTPAPLKDFMITDQTDLYLLCKPDFQFTLDPLREDIRLQSTLFDYYLHHLLAHGYNFTILAGTIQQRESIALKAIEDTEIELNRK